MIRIAAVQAAPVFLDRDATVEKACALIAEAARGGARLVVFPESFVPGYPDWVWLVPAGRGPMLASLYGELLANAVSVPSDSTRRLGDAAREAGVHVAIGIAERNDEASRATMYNSLLLLDDKGEVAGVHRKLVPTGGERLVWAQGDASGLRVHDTPIGRVGGLICWENYMPLARYALYAAGVQIYLAPTWDHGEGWLATLRHIAREARAYVVGCSIAMTLAQIPERYEFRGLYSAGRVWVNPGGSAIVDPKGNVIAGPEENRETILYADIDLDLARGAKWDMDAAGHYARPDIFELRVDRSKRSMVED
jgi:nitrilase